MGLEQAGGSLTPLEQGKEPKIENLTERIQSIRIEWENLHQRLLDEMIGREVSLQHENNKPTEEQDYGLTDTLIMELGELRDLETSVLQRAMEISKMSDEPKDSSGSEMDWTALAGLERELQECNKEVNRMRKLKS